MLDVSFFATLIATISLGGCLVVSILRPTLRIWPPPGRNSWQYRLVWTLTGLCAVGIAAVGVLDWNTFSFSHWSRIPVGAILMVGGLAFAMWGVRVLGVHATSGLKHLLVEAGPYRLTRNPQYVGDIVLLLGWGILANSLRAWVLCIPAMAWFALTPFTEEPWLRKQYGEAYDAYCQRVPRFLGRPHGVRQQNRP